MSEYDPFYGCSEVAGLEHLGRAIVDADGVPSGSPANFEATRGKGAAVLTAEERDVVVANIANEYATDKPVAEAHPWAAEAHD